MKSLSHTADMISLCVFHVDFLPLLNFPFNEVISAANDVVKC